MSKEAMKQALEALEIEQAVYLRAKLPVPEYLTKAIAALRQAIDAYLLSSKPPGLCMCGQPWRLESVHRKKSPCFDYIEHQWVGLTDEEVSKILDDVIGFNSCWGPEEEFARTIEAKLKEKNT